MALTSLAILGLTGGLLALDATSVGQFMVSRPIVAGAITGWVVGHPTEGLFLGALLELYMLVSFPVGGARFPEGPTATVVTVASAVGSAGTGAIPIAIAVGLVWGHLGGWTITELRRLNGRLIVEPDQSTLSVSRVVSSHLLALLLDFARGAIVTLTGVLAGRAAVHLATPAWPLPASDSLGLLLVGAAVSAGILLRSLGGFHRRKLVFAAGLAVGLLWVRFL